MGDLNTPSFSGSIQLLIDDALSSVHIGMPARIETYDQSQQRASVKPILRQAHTDEAGDRVAADVPIIEGVPVKFPGGGDCGLTFPLAKGDLVWLDFGEGSLDKWLTYGSDDVDPDDDRRNAISDATATPGIRTFNNPTDQVDSGAAVLYGPEVLLGGKDATDPVVRESDLTALKTYLDTHVHLGVTTGAGVSGVPGAPGPVPSPTITGSTKVKSE